jgi:predicted N-acetyltransferase YhbS
MSIIRRSELPDNIAMIRTVNAPAFDTNAEAEVFMIKELLQGSLAGPAGIARHHQLFNEL